MTIDFNKTCLVSEKLSLNIFLKASRLMNIYDFDSELRCLLTSQEDLDDLKLREPNWMMLYDLDGKISRDFSNSERLMSFKIFRTDVSNVNIFFNLFSEINSLKDLQVNYQKMKNKNLKYKYMLLKQ